MSEPIGALASEWQPGRRVGRYEIIRAVAAGGMGRVWLARFSGEHGFEKLVAIKTMLPELAADDSFRSMFLDEARLCARLAHANVAQILDLGQHEGLPYIVFEWVDGWSLREVFEKGESSGVRPPLGPVLRVLADMCDGLHAAHELTDEAGRPLGVVHRDVTPGNIIVSPRGYAKLIDFGLAKAKGRLAGETRTGVVKGTPQYMAPEQARGDAVDRRCDVWALGAVLYRAIAGRPPFADRIELEAFVLRRAVLDPLPADAPANARAIVERAMRRDPSERFPTAEELRFAIEEGLPSIDARPRVGRLVEALALPSPSPQASGELTAGTLDLALAQTSLAMRASHRNAEAPTSVERPARAHPVHEGKVSVRLKVAFAAAVVLAIAMVGAFTWAVLARP